MFPYIHILKLCIFKYYIAYIAFVTVNKRKKIL